MAGLFNYVYRGHSSMLEYYDQVRDSHRLSVLALLLSEENYHTQLEIYELFSLPNQKRIDDFHKHETSLNQQFDETYRAFAESKGNTNATIMLKLEGLKESLPRIRDDWHKFVETIVKNSSRAEQSRLLLLAEKKFDEERFNEQIKDIVEMQLAEVQRADRMVQELTTKNNLIVMAGIAIAFILTCLIIFLHRTALRGKTNELQLVQAGKLASLGQLSAGMAHELNSPLMFIKGYNNRVRSLLTKQNFDTKSDVWNFIAEVDSGAERINKIVRHFRDFSRLSNNEMKPVSINQVVSRSFILFEEQLRMKEVTVSLHLSESDPLILADANRIEQILLNLISNACDAFAEQSGKKKITVTTETDEKEVLVKFRDSGVGIAKDHLSRIFDPFFTTKPTGVGTGLGLSISAGIIRDHHGKIEVESEPMQGTEFTITFPLLECAKRNVTSA